jgi:hypothetical protein
LFLSKEKIILYLFANIAKQFLHNADMFTELPKNKNEFKQKFRLKNK